MVHHVCSKEKKNRIFPIVRYLEVFEKNNTIARKVFEKNNSIIYSQMQNIYLIFICE